MDVVQYVGVAKTVRYFEPEFGFKPNGVYGTSRDSEGVRRIKDSPNCRSS